MNKAILLKEWIKIRIILLVALVASFSATIYALLKINRVISFKGGFHLWEIILTRDVVFIEVLKYIPLLLGVMFAVAQFVPEMTQKRLKLTLHLPYSHTRMIAMMLLSGISMLILIDLANVALMSVYLNSVLPAELLHRVLITSVPWYMGGIAAYAVVAWICLEPTRGRKVSALFIGLGVVYLFFASDYPQAYDNILGILLLVIVALFFFAQLSVARFKAGCQD